MKIPTNIMAVEIDPTKQVHQGVATAYPEVILLSYLFENSYEASSHRMGEGNAKQLAYEKAKFILSSIKIIKDLPLNPEREMKAEIIRQLAVNISQVKDSTKIIEKKLDKDLLSQTGQNLTSLKSVSTVTASVLLGETLNPDR